MSATVMGGGLLLYWFQNSSLEFAEEGEVIEELSKEGGGLEFLLKCGEGDKLVDNGAREVGETEEGLVGNEDKQVGNKVLAKNKGHYDTYLRSERKKLVFNPPTVLCRLFGVNDDVLKQ